MSMSLQFTPNLEYDISYGPYRPPHLPTEYRPPAHWPIDDLGTRSSVYILKLREVVFVSVCVFFPRCQSVAR
jgi:hypothetical protein